MILPNAFFLFLLSIVFFLSFSTASFLASLISFLVSFFCACSFCFSSFTFTSIASSSAILVVVSGEAAITLCIFESVESRPVNSVNLDFKSVNNCGVNNSNDLLNSPLVVNVCIKSRTVFASGTGKLLSIKICCHPSSMLTPPFSFEAIHVFFSFGVNSFTSSKVSGSNFKLNNNANELDCDISPFFVDFFWFCSFIFS